MKSPQIDLNKVKEVLKKLSFLKNNLALLVPILIVIVAALLFIPTTLLSARLKNTITEQSVKTAAKIDTLIRDVSAAGQAEAMEGYLNAYAQDPCSIENLMKQTTMRELLTYKIFPDTNETSPLLFDPVRRAYMAGVDAMIERLGAGGPPADGDIDAALEKSRGRSMYGGRTGAPSTGAGGSAYGMNTGRNFRMMTEMDRKIVSKLCEDRARGLRLYASPADLDGYSFWSDWKFEDKKKAVRQSWYWQMGYWILEDVADTILEMNKSGASVLDSPVKRIMNVTFTQSKQATRMIGGRRGRGVRKTTSDQFPSYAINLKTSLAAPPCTGRFCSEEQGYDAMHFEVYVLVSADQVMPFIQELCSAKTHKFRGWYGDQPEQTFKHNQITVLESSVIPVDLEDPQHGSYRYGNEAVVGLDLICEYLFIRAGYEEIKPPEVKNDILGVSDEEAN
jgi:hypothetical protein